MVAVDLRDVVHAADVRVADLSGKADLCAEAREAGGVGREVGRQELQRNRLAEGQVVRAVHLAHAAAPGEGDDPVAAGQDGTGHEAGLVAPPGNALRRRGRHRPRRRACTANRHGGRGIVDRRRFPGRRDGRAEPGSVRRAEACRFAGGRAARGAGPRHQASILRKRARARSACESVDDESAVFAGPADPLEPLFDIGTGACVRGRPRTGGDAPPTSETVAGHATSRLSPGTMASSSPCTDSDRSKRRPARRSRSRSASSLHLC